MAHIQTELILALLIFKDFTNRGFMELKLFRKSFEFALTETHELFKSFSYQLVLLEGIEALTSNEEVCKNSEGWPNRSSKNIFKKPRKTKILAMSSFSTYRRHRLLTKLYRNYDSDLESLEFDIFNRPDIVENMSFAEENLCSIIRGLNLYIRFFFRSENISQSLVLFVNYFIELKVKSTNDHIQLNSSISISSNFEKPISIGHDNKSPIDHGFLELILIENGILSLSVFATLF